MEFETVVATLNSLLRTKQPNGFDSSWIRRNAPSCYRFIQEKHSSRIRWNRLGPAYLRIRPALSKVVETSTPIPLCTTKDNDVNSHLPAHCAGTRLPGAVGQDLAVLLTAILPPVMHPLDRRWRSGRSLAGRGRVRRASAAGRLAGRALRGSPSRTSDSCRSHRETRPG